MRMKQQSIEKNWAAQKIVRVVRCHWLRNIFSSASVNTVSDDQLFFSERLWSDRWSVWYAKDRQHLCIFNLVLRTCSRDVQCEADPRRAEELIRCMMPEMCTSVCTPGTKKTAADVTNDGPLAKTRLPIRKQGDMHADVDTDTRSACRSSKTLSNWRDDRDSCTCPARERAHQGNITSIGTHSIISWSSTQSLTSLSCGGQGLGCRGFMQDPLVILDLKPTGNNTLT